MKKALVIDPSIAGISGDMLLGALVSLGFKPEGIYRVAKEVERIVPWVKQVDVDIKEVHKNEFKAWRVDIKVSEDRGCRKGMDLLNSLDSVAKALSLSDKAYRVARNTIELLITAEAEVHGEDIEDVDLCEIGSADTIIDVVGVALALQELDLLDAKVYGLPIAVGGGTIRFSHGVAPIPAPVVLEIVRKKNAIIIGGTIEEELTTPTGAALYATIVQEIVRFYPEIRVIGVGYGAGQKDFPYIPNVLRLVIGEVFENYAHDFVIVLETDLDDVPGEVLGYVGEKLIALGALDVSFVPKLGKKGRPSVTLRVLAKPDEYEKLINSIVMETGTLGVRVLRVPRYIVPIREFKVVPIDIGGKKYEVKVKISRTNDGKIIAIKPEYEDLKKLSMEVGIPMRVLINKVNKQLYKDDQ